MTLKKLVPEVREQCPEVPAENILHYGDLRGRNELKNCSLVFIVGCQPPSLDAVAQSAATMFALDCDPSSLVGDPSVQRRFQRGAGNEGKAFWLFPAEDCKTFWPPPEWKRFQELPVDIIHWPEQWIDRFEENRAVASNLTDDNFRDDFTEWQTREAFGVANLLRPYHEWLFICGGNSRPCR